MATKRSNKSNIRNIGSHDEERPIATSSHPQEASSMLDDNDVYRVKKDDGEDIISSKSLTQNTYGIIYVADPKSWAFVYGIVFFLIQVSLLSFALIGAFSTSYKPAADICYLSYRVTHRVPSRKMSDQTISSKHRWMFPYGSELQDTSFYCCRSHFSEISWILSRKPMRDTTLW